MTTFIAIKMLTIKMNNMKIKAKYDGLEEIRFDFMVQDFINKKQ